MLKFDYNHFGEIEIPYFILCNPDKRKIGIINAVHPKMSLKFNDIDTISFVTYRYNKGKPRKTYDKIEEMKYIYVQDHGYYQITDIEVVGESDRKEYKTVTATSIECALGQKNLDLFTINMGTTESIDGVSFYDIAHPDKSLLHLVLTKFPDWSIGHVDEKLISMQRCFEVSSQDVYSFLTKDVAEAFECIFLFDTLHNRIDIYDESTIGQNTGISISLNNLAKKISIKTNTDNIKTCLKLIGDNELTVREINMGYDCIYNIDYYHDLNWMSQGLYDAYSAWKTKWNTRSPEYTELVTQYQRLYDNIYQKSTTMSPSSPNSTNWTQYSLSGLRTKQSEYESIESVYMSMGYGSYSSDTESNYQKFYLPNHNTISNIKSEIRVRENEINTLKTQQDSIYSQMQAIINDVSMESNFTSDQLVELSKYIREDTLSDNNFVVTDSMSDSEKMDAIKELMNFGQKELYKISQPIFDFDSDIVNLYALKEFKNRMNKFDVGNYIYISLRDDYSIKARILSIDIDFDNFSNINIKFGNVMRAKSKNILTDITDGLSQASKINTSVSFNSSHWNKAQRDTSKMWQMIDNGLIDSGAVLKSNQQSELLVDTRGLFVSNVNGDYPNDSIYIGGGRILFTDDDWLTVSEAIGRVTINGESVFGVIAKSVLAGYIYGSEIVGSKINNGNGTFSVDENGKVIASNMHVTGGSLTIGSNFSVDNNGTLNSTNGYFSGTIRSSNAYITGGQILINTDDASDDFISLNSGTKQAKLSPGWLSVNFDSNKYFLCSSGKCSFHCDVEFWDTTKFSGITNFSSVCEFTSSVEFNTANFKNGATFQGTTDFNSATFSKITNSGTTTLNEAATFNGTSTFNRSVWFGSGSSTYTTYFQMPTSFSMPASFLNTTTFKNKVTFSSSVEFSNPLTFSPSATFNSSIVFGNSISSLKYSSYNLLSTDSYGRVTLGQSTTKLGFFGASGSSKKTVATIYSTSSATASSNATKINEIINALKGYGMM